MHPSNKSNHFVMLLPLRDGLSYFGDRAGELDTHDLACIGGERIFPFALRDVHAIYPKGFDLKGGYLNT